MTLNVTVKNRIATYVSGQGIPVCGNTGDQVKFTFDEEWSQHETKTARFKWGGKVFDQEFTGNICEIPNIDNTDSITVGVFVGEEENGEDELSTTDTRIPYRRSTRCGNNIPHGESGESYTNLAKGYAASAKADADRTEELLTEYIDDVDALIGGEGVEGGGSVDSCEIYVAYYPDATNTLTIKTASEFWLEQHGEKPTIITQIVDTLPTVLKEADEENLILYAYILKSTGVGYLDAGGTTITLGQLAFSLDGFDKGWTTDVNSVSDLGVYCVRTQGNSNAGGGIIDVTELPTEGIDEQSIYRVNDATAEWWLYESEYKGDYGKLLAAETGGTLTMLVCDELPQTFVVSTQTVMTVYVVRSTGEMYVSTDGTTATLFLDLLVSMGFSEKPFHGAVGSADEMTEEGYYTLIKATQTYHASKDGNWFEFADQKGEAMKSVECASFDEVYTAILSIIDDNPFVSIVQVCCDGYVSADINSTTTNLYPCSFGVNIIHGDNFGMVFDALCYSLLPTILRVTMTGDSNSISNTIVQHFAIGGTSGVIDDADFSGLKNIRILYF